MKAVVAGGVTGDGAARRRRPRDDAGHGPGACQAIEDAVTLAARARVGDPETDGEALVLEPAYGPSGRLSPTFTRSIATLVVKCRTFGLSKNIRRVNASKPAMSGHVTISTKSALPVT